MINTKNKNIDVKEQYLKRFNLCKEMSTDESLKNLTPIYLFTNRVYV